MFNILKKTWKRIFIIYLFLIFIPSSLPALQDHLSHPLPGWGHEAWFSPSGDKYILYHYIDGLFLYSTDPTVPPEYLAQEPIAAWDQAGKLVACANADQLLIYDLKKKSRFPIPLNPWGEYIVEVITGLEWGPKSDRLLYVSLLDYPQQDSDLFLVTILDARGQRLQNTVIPNLGWAMWLNRQEIILAIYSDMAWEKGRIKVWNYITGEITELLPEIYGGYRELAYNPRTRTLAYTIDREGKRAILTYNMDEGTAQEVWQTEFPIRNLQWSLHNTLFLGDDFHNIIYELIPGPAGHNQLLNRGFGFLPRQGVTEKFVFFLSEPLEEPQQLYLE